MTSRNMLLPSLVVLPLRSDPFNSRGAMQLCYVVDACDDNFRDTVFYGHKNIQTMYPSRTIHTPNKLPAPIWVRQSRARMNKRYRYDRAQGYIDRRNMKLVLDHLMDEDDDDDVCSTTGHGVSGVQPIPFVSAATPAVAQLTPNSTNNISPATSLSTHGQAPANIAYSPFTSSGVNVNIQTPGANGAAPFVAQPSSDSANNVLTGAFVSSQGQTPANTNHTPPTAAEFTNTNIQAPGHSGATPAAVATGPPTLFPSVLQPGYSVMLASTPVAASSTSPPNQNAPAAEVINAADRTNGIATRVNQCQVTGVTVQAFVTAARGSTATPPQANAPKHMHTPTMTVTLGPATSPPQHHDQGVLHPSSSIVLSSTHVTGSDINPAAVATRGTITTSQKHSSVVGPLTSQSIVAGPMALLPCAQFTGTRCPQTSNPTVGTCSRPTHLHHPVSATREAESSTMGILGQEPTSARIQALEDYKLASKMVDYQRMAEDLDSMALKGTQAAITAQRDLAAAAAQVKGKAKAAKYSTTATIIAATPIKAGSTATTSGTSTAIGNDDGSVRPIARTRRPRTA